jgi:serine/threonine protein kinase
LKPDDFEVLRVLGRGSFGKVLLARRYADQHLYAVKVLEKRAVVRRNETQHIMAERNVLRNNQLHPFLVSLHASFQTREKLYFVLDFVNGGEVTFIYYYSDSILIELKLT